MATYNSELVTTFVPLINESEYDYIQMEVETSDCFVPVTFEIVASPYIRAFLYALYSATSLVALVGNAVVITVQLRGSESSRSIRKYLLNLAISDLLIGVCSVPMTYTNMVLGRWVFPHWLCPTAQYVQLLSVFVTSGILSIIAIER